MNLPFRSGVGLRLALLCLAFGLPLAVMFTLMTRAQLEEASFAERELAGDDYLRPLFDVLEHASEHRLLRARGARPELLRAEASAVTSALGSVDRAWGRHEGALQLHPTGLALRHREDFTAARLRTLWERDLASDDASVDDAHAALVEHVRTMITHAGDTSNLILDPDLDSYYLMDATLLALPQMRSRLDGVRRDVERLVPGEPLAASFRARLTTTRAFLAEADWQRTEASLRKSVEEDGNFHGKSPTLAPSLSSPVATARSATSRFIADLDAIVSGDGGIAPARLHALREDGDALAASVHVLHRIALDEEDRLLRTRIHDVYVRLWIGIALAFVAVFLAGQIAFFLASDIARRVRRVAAVTNRFAEGDLEARVGPAGADEIGDLAIAFDGMAKRITSLTAEVTRRADALATLNVALEDTVLERTKALRARSDELSLILETCAEGMVTIDLHGWLSAERSRRLSEWLAVPATGPVTLDACLAPHAPETAAMLRLGLEQVREDILPTDVALEQLPRRFSAAGRSFELAFRPIYVEGRLTNLLVVISDVTSVLAARRAAEREAESLRIVQAWKRDSRGLQQFAREARATVALLMQPDQLPSSVETMRILHTLKGTSALMGLMSFATVCHEVEDAALEADRELPPGAAAKLCVAWEEASVALERVCGDADDSRIEVRLSEHRRLVEAVVRGTPRPLIAETLRTWKLDLAEQHLARFAEEARVVAERIGKQVKVSTRSDGLRLDSQAWAPIWSVFTHVVRNAVSHGIEAPEVREAAGKSRAGHLAMSVDTDGERIWVELQDDGAGIRWESLAERARSLGLPSSSRDDLLEALFTDGVSTRATVDEVSGRGVGMAAVRAACRKLGGDVVVTSEPGRGTVFRLDLPLVSMVSPGVDAALRSFAPSLLPAA